METILLLINKAALRFELRIEDLQSTALPLGYTAYFIFFNVVK